MSLLAFWLALCAPLPCLAATGTTGQDLLLGCRTAAEGRALDFQAGLCLGTIVTVLNLTQQTVVRNEFVVCKDPAASVNQALKVVLRYMEANPQALKKELAGIAVNAMQLVWPCPKKNERP
jgi:hypothetical protein